RYDAAIAAIVADGGSEVVAVSHGAAIRVWAAARCETAERSFAGTHQLDNTGAVTLQSVRDGRWKMLAWHSAPLGGEQLRDRSAIDPTGERTEGA
ncbi:MAG TPA: histidine phosphatase family protein, partial [Galbitalea sp.]